MRRLLIALAAVAVAALGIVPALADGPVHGSLCGDITVIVNGETVVDESDCLPGDAPALPGLPEAPGAPGLPSAPELPAPPSAPELPALPGLPV